MTMKLKTHEVDGQTYALVKDGLPVYVNDNGDEITFDAAHAVSKIAALNAESKAHREAKEAAEARAKAFDGIEDPDAARAALDTIANLQSGDLATADRVAEVKREAIAAVEAQKKAAIEAKEAQIAELAAERDMAKTQLHNELIGGSFARSKFVQDKIAVPADMLQKTFGDYFKVEDGAVVAMKGDTPIYSRERAGEIAGFDEALEILVADYPHRESILRGANNSGGGAAGGEGGGSGKRISRTNFDKLDPMAQRQHIADGFEVHN